MAPQFKPKSIQEMNVKELEWLKMDLEDERSNFRAGLLKIHLTLWLIVISLIYMFTSSAHGHPGFMTGKYFVVIIAIVAIGLVVNLAFVYKRNLSFKARIHAVNVELIARDKEAN
ncbi:MAG: hypothetical protein ABSC77_07255 [Terracidiphilus sp.]|jgi:membrane protease YdiL (CAAX protease family)